MIVSGGVRVDRRDDEPLVEVGRRVDPAGRIHGAHLEDVRADGQALDLVRRGAVGEVGAVERALEVEDEGAVLLLADEGEGRDGRLGLGLGAEVDLGVRREDVDVRPRVLRRRRVHVPELVDGAHLEGVLAELHELDLDLVRLAGRGRRGEDGVAGAEQDAVEQALELELEVDASGRRCR